MLHNLIHPDLTSLQGVVMFDLTLLVLVIVAHTLTSLVAGWLSRHHRYCALTPCHVDGCHALVLYYGYHFYSVDEPRRQRAACEKHEGLA